CLQSFQLPFTF
nr:immunoglobulin light chain junction region [Macaca mulatta]MOW52960.1 immunoglobulin light chain junction region [Macaca mulatta]MOW53843.1 immunoglobulin light chain junction region [Macaca mulatta]MOW54018.1 immunoglobulin light chain junction region [Macaca mulatta]MOW54416.1 immunoglobulin light chain junction region [Macaca mulatta]